MKIVQLINPEFMAAMRRLLGQEIPGKTAFKLRGLVNKLNEQLEAFQQTRGDIMSRHCLKDEEGKAISENGNYKFSDESAAVVTAEMNELLQVEVEHATIKVDELGERFQMSAADAIVLSAVIVE